jgi:glucans biosynthesis protein
LSLILVLAVACDPALEQNTTVSQSDRDTNPGPTEVPFANDSSISLLAPLTPATLFEHITERARRLAEIPYAPPEAVLPAALERMDYEQYRSIRFRPEAALWHNETPFEVQLFHPGSLYRESVRIHLVHEQQIAALSFDKNRFRYDGRAASIADIVSPALGYAGFRIHYPLNSTAIKDEVVAFLGASYFRLLGQGHVYGLSSRGLAVDVALESGEEFPSFREFWLVRPGPEATTLTFYALLDSPSVTGAYRFDLEPGAPTTLEVDARLFARHDVAKLGVAPLSSMFLYGPDRTPPFDDFRPQVHDSDGLLMHTAAGEWIWRPLGNGPGLQVTSLRDDTPWGFGLVQRDRDFDNYLDLETNYHRRPSEWVALGEGDWGSGVVELLAIPADSEFNDNMAAYWVPDQPFMAGDERRYRYRLMTFDSRLETQTLAAVERTRIGRDALPGQSASSPPSQRRIIVDFSGGDLSSFENTQPVEAQLETSAGQTSDLRVQPLPDGRGWRAAFRLAPEGNRPADMRLYLTLDGRRLTETWSYVWYPDRVQ